MRRVAILSGIAFLIGILAAGMTFTTYPDRSQSSDKVVHFSFDDVENLFIDIRKNEKSYSSIFNNVFLSKLRDYHQKYDAKFTLYTYDSIADFELIDFPSHFKKEFEDNSDWLKIGFHWSKAEFDSGISKKDFEKSFMNVESAIINFAGEATLSHTLRLHYFYGPDSLLTIVKRGGIRCYVPIASSAEATI